MQRQPMDREKITKDSDEIAGIERAIESLDRGEGVRHHRVKKWVLSWGSKEKRPAPKRLEPANRDIQ